MVTGFLALLTAHRLARLALLLPIVLLVTGFIYSGIVALISTIDLPVLFVQLALYFWVDKAFLAFIFFVQCRIMWRMLDKWISII